MKRLGEVVAVVAALALVAWVVLPTPDRHDAVLTAHERARDSLVVLAAREHDRAQHAYDAARMYAHRAASVRIVRDSLHIPPRPDVRVTPAPQAWLDRDAALVHALAVDSALIAAQDSAYRALERAYVHRTAEADTLRAALAHADSALAVAKAPCRVGPLPCPTRRAAFVAGVTLTVAAVAALRR